VGWGRGARICMGPPGRGGSWPGAAVTRAGAGRASQAAGRGLNVGRAPRRFLRYTRRVNWLAAIAVGAVVAGLLWLNLDSGLVAAEPAARLVSLPLEGLAAIFGVRAWTEMQSATPRWPSFFAGLSLGVGRRGPRPPRPLPA